MCPFKSHFSNLGMISLPCTSTRWGMKLYAWCRLISLPIMTQIPARLIWKMDSCEMWLLSVELTKQIYINLCYYSITQVCNTQLNLLQILLWVIVCHRDTYYKNQNWGICIFNGLRSAMVLFWFVSLAWIKINYFLIDTFNQLCISKSTLGKI